MMATDGSAETEKGLGAETDDSFARRECASRLRRAVWMKSICAKYALSCTAAYKVSEDHAEACSCVRPQIEGYPVFCSTKLMR